MLRAAYALGGLGSGVAKNEEELRDICQKVINSNFSSIFKRIRFSTMFFKFSET